MSPGSFIEHPQSDQTVHVLLRGEHFYILVPEDAPAEEKKRAEKIANITEEYVQAVVNKKGKNIINAIKKRVFLKMD